MSLRPLLVALVLAPMIAACQTTIPFSTAPDRSNMTQLAEIRGFVSYMQRIALPRDATVTVSLVDVGMADTPGEVIATTRFATGGAQVPIAFALSHDPARLLNYRRYALRARIDDGAGQALWITDSAWPLPDPGRPIDLPLVPAR